MKAEFTPSEGRKMRKTVIQKNHLLQKQYEEATDKNEINLFDRLVVIQKKLKGKNLVRVKVN